VEDGVVADVSGGVGDQTGDDDGEHEGGSGPILIEVETGEEGEFDKDGDAADLDNPDAVGPDFDEEDAEAGDDGEDQIGDPGFARRFVEKPSPYAGGPDQVQRAQADAGPAFAGKGAVVGGEEEAE